MSWFQNDFTEMFLLSPFTKIAKMGSALLNKMVTRAENRKPLNDIFMASGKISK